MVLDLNFQNLRGLTIYEAGKAQKLVFTGGKMPRDKAKKTEGEVLKKYAISNGIPAEKIFVTKDVMNTTHNEVPVKELCWNNAL